LIKIKICGITNLEDALNAANCGSDALGFIFYQKSPRYVAPEVAREIIEKLPPEIKKVGVFVNQAADTVRELLEFCGLDMIQLHGDESPDYCRQFPASTLIKAFSLRSANDLLKLKSYSVKAILVDTYDPERYGGTGKKANWELAVTVKETHPLILSGGLNAANIRQAIEIVSPYAVDINSGAEISPGKKDPELVRKIIEIVRQVNQEKKSLTLKE